MRADTGPIHPGGTDPIPGSLVLWSLSPVSQHQEARGVPPSSGLSACGCTSVRFGDLADGLLQPLQEAAAQQPIPTRPLASRSQVAQSTHGPQLGEQRSAPFHCSSIPWVLEALQKQSHDLLRTEVWLHQEPGCIRTGTHLALVWLCQPHSAHPGVLPMAAAFCFLALLGDGSPAWHPSSCLHPSPSSCLGLVSWEGTKGSSRAECKAGAGEVGESRWVRAECICKALPPPAIPEPTQKGPQDLVPQDLLRAQCSWAQETPGVEMLQSGLLTPNSKHMAAHCSYLGCWACRRHGMFQCTG